MHNNKFGLYEAVSYRKYTEKIYVFCQYGLGGSEIIIDGTLFIFWENY